MAGEVVSLLSCKAGGIYVDCTLGGGGHAVEILKASSPDGRLIGIDRDGEAIEESKIALEEYGERVTLVRSDYLELAGVLAELGVEGVDGILVDLGVSSHQLDAAERGFSFMKAGPLDMRMDQGSGETASQMLKRLSAEELESIIRRFGEERWARRIAGAIKERGDIETTIELARIVESAIPARHHPKKLHAATKTFQAIRIAVNKELVDLADFVISAVDLLNKGGRIAVISFHSLEDRIIKRAFRGLSSCCICPPDLPYCRCGKKDLLKVITGRSVTASAREVEMNPRARSARLRVAEKV